MKKIILIISIIFLIVMILISQRYRFFFTYTTNTIDSLDVFIRTNVITGDTEMLNPLTLEWIDSKKLLELKEINNAEEREKRIKTINDEIERLQDIINGKTKLDPKSWEYVRIQRSGEQLETYLQDMIESLENELEKIDKDKN